MTPLISQATDEPMVDPQTAAHLLNLPHYYLRQAGKRKALGIPCYHIGHLLRFRLSELQAWCTRHMTAPDSSVSHDR